MVEEGYITTINRNIRPTKVNYDLNVIHLSAHVIAPKDHAKSDGAMSYKNALEDQLGQSVLIGADELWKDKTISLATNKIVFRRVKNGKLLSNPRKTV